MFSSLRHVVESAVSQHSPKPSLDGVNPTEEETTRGSLDAVGIRQTLSSSTQLADTALSSLRKTLVSPRPASPASAARSSPNPENQQRQRTTLEDRLRAKFAIGDASNVTSPSQSTRSTPSATPGPAADRPLSPASPAVQPPPSSEEAQILSPKSTPLPDSPLGSIAIASPKPEVPTAAHPLTGFESDPPPTLQLDADSSSHSLSLAGLGDTETSALPDHSEAIVTTPAHTVASLESNVSENATTKPPVDVEPSDVLIPDQPSDPKNSDSAFAVPLFTETNRQSSRSSHAEESNSPQSTTPETSMLEESFLTMSEVEAESVDQAVQQPATPLTVPADIHVSDVREDLETHVENPRQEPAAEDLTAGQKILEEISDSSVEALQQRLKLVEQRFADVSTSFKRLQAERAAADRVLRELTPVESIAEAESLRDFVQNMNLKTEMAQDEIKRLSGKLTRQEERIEELRDIHRLESKSQSDQIHKLRAQLDEAEALLKASQNSISHLETERTKQKAEVDRLHSEVEKTKTAVKDEEEKRVKAVSLLKTVRQKLVKAEKERDDVTKEMHNLKEKHKEESDKDKTERQKLQDEIQRVNAERETAVQGLRAQFDKEVAGLKDKYEKEISALRGQYELEMITLKSLHSKETETSNARIADLESSARILTGEKDDIFDQLQMRQAELESSQSHLESLQSQTVELQYQLREATDRVALLADELAESRKEHVSKVHDSPPAEEVTRLLSATEAKYEARIADLRRQVAAVERERDEAESLFSKRISEKATEVEKLQSIVNRSTKDREQEGEIVAALQKEIENLKEASTVREQLIAELQTETGKITEVEVAAQAQVEEIKAKVGALEHQLEESKAREGQMRAHVKTLREELRKVQSSAALLERQRNPGVGYWATRPDGPSEQRSPTSSVSDLARESSSRPSSPTIARSDEEVNYEYLRNVILQFLEHKEMRPHLVRILSTILHFTPQETRRLIAKV